MERENSTWTKTTRYIAGVGLALFGIFVLYLSRSLIPLLIIAGLIAIIVRPIVLWLHNTARFAFGLAVTLVYLILAIVLPLALLLALPAILNLVNFFANLDYPSIVQNIIAWLHATLWAIKAQPFPAKILNLYVDQAVDSLLNAIDQTAIVQPGPASISSMIQSLSIALTNTYRTATGVVASLFSSITLVLFTFLASVYISLSTRTTHDAIPRALPDRFRPELTILIARIDRTWKAFVGGELILMVTTGIIIWLGLTILCIPGAPYLGIAAGLLQIVPIIGPVLAAVPAVIIALLQGSTYLWVSPLFMAFLVVLFYCLIQLIENNLIGPKVLGKAVNLPALVVMTGVLVGAEVGGLLGVLLATPLIATVREIVFYIYKKILGESPFPPEEEPQTTTAALPSDKLCHWRIGPFHIFRHVSRQSQD